MKLTGTTQDAPSVETRTSGRPAADQSSNDNNSPPFDGVLADVQTGRQGSSPKPSSPKPSNPDVSATKPSQAADPSTQKSSAVPVTTTLATPSTAVGGDTTIIDALIGILDKGVSVAATPGMVAPSDKNDSQTASSDDGGSARDIVDALLKRMTSKDDVVNATQVAGPPPPAASPTDLMSILLLGSGAKPVAPPPTQSGSDAASAATTSGTAAMAGLLDRRSTAPSSASAPPVTAKEVLVTDISVSTHLAPVTTPQNGAMPSSNSKAAKDATLAAAGAAFSAVTTAPKIGEEAIAAISAVSHRDAEPSAASAAASLSMGADFGAVRHIATAIGDLAVKTAPAVAAAEAAKPALGVARTMTLQMNPANLGTVDIRMHMTGQTLDVQLTISNPETLGMVSRERDTLTTALRDQNYQVNSLVIQDGGAAALSGGNNAATHSDTQSGNARADRQSDAPGSDASGSGRQGQGSGRSASEDRRPSRDVPPRPVAVSRRDSGSLFV